MVFSISGPAFGDKVCRSVFQVFSERKKQMFENERCYFPGNCHHNTYRFVSHLKRMDEAALENANVLVLSHDSRILFPIKGFTEIVASAGDGWGVHVMLEKNGRVYDFDYRRENIRVPKAKRYFKSMFVHESKEAEQEYAEYVGIRDYDSRELFDGIMVSKVKAGEFLAQYGKRSEYGDRKDIFYYAEGLHQKNERVLYPINEYLNEIGGWRATND